MPKSIQISEEERNFIKKSIDEKFELKINSANDCEILSNLIYKELNVLISYNTIRRFFKILPNSNFPSLYTVNIISRIIGFKDFIALRAFRLNLNRDFIHENLHLFTIQAEIDDNILNEILPLLNEAHWENIYQIRSLIELLIEKDKIELIDPLFNKEIQDHDWELMYKYYVAFQPIHKAAKLNNRKVIDFIKGHINKSKIVQQVLLQLYVEEDCLVGYYGEWVNACSTYLCIDTEIFCTCMQLQYQYIKNDIEASKLLLNKLNDKVAHYTHKIHPIILGRIAAWNFIINNNGAYIEKYMVNTSSDTHEQISTLIFFYRLVCLYGTKQQFIKFDYITLLQTDTLQYVNLPFNIKTELSMYYLMLTKYYVETDKKDKALTTIQKIDTRYQFTCTADFFIKEYKLLNHA